jgi:hypothetical protein
MNRIIDDCLTNQFKQSDYIMELFKIVDKILNNPGLWNQVFEDNGDEDVEEESVEIFSQSELVNILYLNLKKSFAE